MNHRRSPQPRYTPVLHLKPLLLSVVVGLIPIISGMLILFWQVDRSLMRESIATGQRAIANLERILERADDLTARASAMAGGTCAQNLEQLRRMVVGYPAVRSIALGNADGLYCSTEMGQIEVPLSPEMVGMTPLLLRAGSVATPDRPSMVFRRFEGANSLNASIDGQVLAQGLAQASNGADVVLELNGLFLGANGLITAYDFDDPGVHHAVQHSPLYGYRMHSAYRPDSALQAFKAQALPIFGSLLLLGVITGGVCHWLSRQPYRRHRS
jgi:hypothetical protein